MFLWYLSFIKKKIGRMLIANSETARCTMVFSALPGPLLVLWDLSLAVLSPLMSLGDGVSI